VNLESDVTLAILFIDQMAGWHIINPNLDCRTNALDTEVRPFTQGKCRPRIGVVFEVKHPSPRVAEVVEYAASPASRGVVDLHLVAI